jgi:two-component system response regulator QseB
MREWDVGSAPTARERDPSGDAPAGHPPLLLLVAGDHALIDVLVPLLSQESYEIELAPDARRGLQLGLARTHDVVVMDRLLPDGDALDLLMRLRTNGMVSPTLLLTALDTPADRVAGLDAGAEDCLAKPFHVPELLARLRVLCRRTSYPARRLPVPGGLLDLETNQVIMRDRAGPRLSARESALLAVLAGRPRKVFSRDELRLLAFDDAGKETIDTYVHYLRRKLGRDVVRTVRGYGYQLGALRR